MRFIADLHIHSRYSRATSRDMSPEALWKWAQLKGITVIGTGDFTHPAWIEELSDKLEPLGNGLYKLRSEFESNDVPESCMADVFFLLSAEISCIYRKRDKTRKVHCILLAKDISDVYKINKTLSDIGNLSADGRPILGLDAKRLLKIVLDISPDTILIPAHAWTPHFSVFGAASGFDSLEECFEELTPHVHAIETGLSSDPPMNWRLSALDKICLVSNSDAHSPSKIGREATIFDAEIGYDHIAQALKTKKGLAGTIEFFPEEGKYHYDGHRSCGVSMAPEATIASNYLCPVCGRKMTIGVMHRVEKLADRPEGAHPQGMPPFYSIIPLPEIIAETLKVGVSSKAVYRMYMQLLNSLGNEFGILIDAGLRDIEETGSPLLREAISKMREGDVQIAPGFDGEFGKTSILEPVAVKEPKGQNRLF